VQAVDLLLSGTGLDNIRPGVLRSSSRSAKQFSVNRGVDDDGVFHIDFSDEHYSPFEGAGAVSRWELRIPKAFNKSDFTSLTDVIINVHYTAIDGGDTFRRTVTRLLHGR